MEAAAVVETDRALLLADVGGVVSGVAVVVVPDVADSVPRVGFDAVELRHGRADDSDDVGTAVVVDLSLSPKHCSVFQDHRAGFVRET